MPTTYTGVTTNNPTSIQVPSDGDKLKVASVLPAFQGTWDKLRHVLSGDTAFTGAKTFVSATFSALTMAAHILTDVAPVTDRLMVWKIALGGMYARFYSRKRVASSPFYAPGIEISVNAQWDEVTSKWVADDDTKPARLYEFGGSSAAAFAGDDTPIQIRRKNTTSTDWNADAWDTTIFALGAGNPTALSGALPPNTLFSKGMPKAWGVVTADGAGNVSVGNGYGLGGSGATIVGSAPNRNVRVELRNAMATTNYAIDVTARLPAGSSNYSRVFVVAKPVTTTTFDISWPLPWGSSTAGDQYDAGAGGIDLSASFVVYGEHT